MKQFTILLISLLTASLVGAQHLNQTLGNFTQVKTIDNGYEIQTSHGHARILLYGPSTLRISVSLNENFNDFSYAVIANPQTTPHTWKDQGDVFALETDSCKLMINKKPVRFTLLNKNGILLNQDDSSFGTSWIGEEVSTYKKMQEDERFIGLGEKTGNLNRRGEAYTNWNTDNFAYPSNGDPIYATIPFYMGIHHNVVYGIFLDNSFKSHFNFGASNNRFSSFTAEDGDMNYYLFANSNVAGIIKAYSDLTGRMEMPSLWSLGFQQCRYSYYPESEVLTLAKTFRDKKIPADVIYFDIHYMDQYKIFTWNHDRFPDPKRMLNQLDELGFKNVVIVDPGIKVEKEYKSYEEGLAKDLFVKYPDGSNFTAQVWPGWCHFPDFTNPKTREWWGSSFKGYINDGIDGFWNDMNEPASWGQRIPDLLEANFDGHLATHKQWHNVYGLNMARATYEGSKTLLNGKRPFILTRAAYAGIQRYSAIWTGDNRPEDDHMLAGVRLVNSLGLSGVANAGYDVGGFAGEASIGLFARWIALGSFCPFFRNHKMIDAKDSEPWSYGEKVEEISKNYISLRYKMMPYLYSAFFEATQTSMPVARSLAIDYTHHAKIYDGQYQNQYLFGPALMVCPVTSNKEIMKVYLPSGSNWYDLYTETNYENKDAQGQEIYVEVPIEKLPVFVKGSSIIPMQNLVQNAKESPTDTLFLHIYKGRENNLFTYYEDEGDGYGYKDGKFFQRTIAYSSSNSSVTLEKVQGTLSSKFKHVKVMMHGFGDVKAFKVNGVASKTSKEQIKLMNDMPQFDPIGKAISAAETQVCSFTLANSREPIQIKW